MNQNYWLDRAKNVLPGGGFGNFDPEMIIQEGRGSRVWDIDGNEYVDCLIGSGPMLLGHGHPEILEAVTEQLGKGMTFFATNPTAIELAEEICRAVACADQLRYVSSGGEADMYAIRLARAFNGRDKIVKFEGGYHGMSAEAQMSLAPEKLIEFPRPMPDSAGILDSVRNEILVAPFNDVELTNSIIEDNASEIAGVIVEPLQRIIPPEPGFLESLRQICTKHDIVLIFDEVVTGFRIAYGGAQQHYGVVPDLCTLGKLIGGGFPLAAVAGREDIMAHFDRSKVGAEKFLMQVGTLSGNPVASIAGLKTLEILRRPGQYKKLNETGKRLMQVMSDHLNAAGHKHKIVGIPALFEVVFSDEKVNDYRGVAKGSAAIATRFNQLLREKGIFKTPSKLYVSLALEDKDIDQIMEASDYAAKSL